MADELDPRLEASLRAALHHEADALPMLLRSDDIERARRRRGGRRLALPASLLGLAAVLAILVATGVVGRGLQGLVAASPSVSPAAAALATYEDLDRLLGVEPAEVLRDERPDAATGGEPVVRNLGTIFDTSAHRYAVHCLGGSIDVIATVDGTEIGRGQIDCQRQPSAGIIPAFQGDGQPTGPIALSVRSAPEVRWRLVVAIGAVPEATPQPTPFALETYEELEARLAGSSVMPVILRGEHPVAEAGTEPVRTSLGPVGDVGMEEFAYSCFGGSIQIDKVVGDTVLTGVGTECTGMPRLYTDGSNSVDPAAEIVVTASPQVIWRIVVSGAVISEQPSRPPVTATPSLPPVDAGETGLVTLDITDADPTVTRTVDRPAGTDEYRLVADCSGSGFVVVAVDGVEGTWDCGAIGVEVFAPDLENTRAELIATVTGDARFLLRLDALDQATLPDATFQPPPLTLEGPDAFSGSLASTQAFAGCGISWEPKAGGGFVDDCGPSWQPVPNELVQKPGTTLSISLPDGWTITRVDGAMTRANTILPLGRAPAEVAWDGTQADGTWTFGVPPLGSWGVKLLVTATRDGDAFQVPYYAQVTVMR